MYGMSEILLNYLVRNIHIIPDCTARKGAAFENLLTRSTVLLKQIFFFCPKPPDGDRDLPQQHLHNLKKKKTVNVSRNKHSRSYSFCY